MSRSRQPIKSKSGHGRTRDDSWLIPLFGIAGIVGQRFYLGLQFAQIVRPESRLTKISYDEKLRLALSHTVRENRMIGNPDAEDIYVVRQALIALAAIGTERARSVISQAKLHESPWIRRFALLGQAHQNTRLGSE